jgi:hypothetical protein
MSTKVGIGVSENPNSFEAGIEVAKAAIAESNLTACDLAILYTTPKHNPTQLRDGLRSVIGPTSRLIGGYSVGIITKYYLGYEGYQVGVILLSSDTIDVDMFFEKGLLDDEFKTGVALGQQIKAKAYKGEPNILIMYDAIKERTTEGLSLNLATPLIKGMEQSLGTWPPTAGVGMFGDFQWNPTYQWFDDHIEQGIAMALVLSGGVRMDTVIIHGCKPSSDYHTITKVDRNVVLEIDGKPAVDTISEMLGPGAEVSWEDYPLFITLGVNKGEKFGEFKEEEYANRLCMAVDKERGGLVMFEDDLKEGSEVQLMRRNVYLDYIGKRAEDLLERVGNRRPIFALYIDCAGRASAYCGTEREEAEEVQKVIGPIMPLLGMYSGVEIAQVGKDMQALDWTGVLCVFSE